jgi:hypothetical protein
LKRLVLVLGGVLALGCRSDLRLIADAATAHYYHEARYEAQCVAIDAPTAPATCPAFRAAVNALKREATIADDAKKKGLGKLPPTARRQLKRAMKVVETTP